MRISFTGTGCSGKSTMLKACQEHYGDRFQYITEVTRPLARKGFKINEEGDSATQRAIIDAHIDNDKIDNVIMDRCIIDGYVYTEWLFHEQKVTPEVYEYAYDTLNDILNNIDIIFYCEPLEMKDDGERSTNKKFQDDINCSMTQLLYQEEWNCAYKGTLITLKNKPVDKRFEDIKIAIETHECNTR